MSNFDKLRTFLTLCETGSFTTTAKLLYCSQPTISHQIQQLETYFKTTLFKREGKSVILTDQGAIVKDFANTVIQYLEETENKIEKSINEKKQVLSLYISNYMAEIWFPSFISSFSQRQHSVMLELHSYPYEVLREHLISGKTDFALLPLYANDAKLCSKFNLTPLFEDELILAISTEHHLSSRKHLYSRDLNRQAIMIPRNEFLELLLFEQLMLYGSTNPFVQMSNFTMIKHAVLSNFGIGLLPLKIVQEEIEAGTVVKLPMIGFNIVRKIGLAIKNNIQLSPIEQQLVDDIKSFSSKPKPIT